MYVQTVSTRPPPFSWELQQPVMSGVCVCVCVCAGRDPLLYVTKKVDIAAVASVLKGYFRELSIPLFPTDNYKEFINCTREICLCSVQPQIVPWLSQQVTTTFTAD